MFDKNIVVDVNSGAVHEFDDVAFDVVSLYPASYGENDYFSDAPSDDSIEELLAPIHDREAIREAIKEIKELKEAGLLFTPDVYREYLPHWEKKSVIKALCLHISHDCNLRCKYCFASTGSFGGSRAMMSPEVGKRAIDFVIRESGNRQNIEIDFFGGEPLMNFDTVKEIVNYARSREAETGKKFHFTLTTNALLLDDEKMEYINNTMDNIVLSIDGREEINDKMRLRADGRGSYHSILPKIQKMARMRNQDRYYVRGTFTRENLDFSKDVLHLADLGFRQISIEPVVAGEDVDFSIREEDLPVIYKEYEKLAKAYVERYNTDNWFNFFHFMIDLDQGPCAAKRISGCGSGHEYVAVTPEGDIYPCHQFVGQQEFKMGNVLTGNLDRNMAAEFSKSNIYTREECSKCWARFYCSGGCAANAYMFNKNINKPYKIACDLERKRVECALWINAKLSE